MSRVAGLVAWTLTRMPVAHIVATWRPGSQDPPWTWEDEARDIAERVCVGCDQPGHYQRQIVDKLRSEGEWWDAATIILGNDGRVWDGHHRILAAMELGIESLTVEVASESPHRQHPYHNPFPPPQP